MSMDRTQAIQRCEELLAGWKDATAGPWHAPGMGEVHGPEHEDVTEGVTDADASLTSCSPSLPVLVGWVRDRLMEHAETSYHHRAGRRGTERSCLCGAILPCSAEASLCSLVEKL